MKNPPHPGQHVKLDCLDPLGLSITKAAEILGVSRLTLSNLVIGVIIRLSLKEDYAEVAPIHHKNGCR